MSSRKADANGLVIGGEPRIDFLPPEIKATKQARRTRRSMAALVVAVGAVCVAGYVFATVLAIQAEGALDEEHAHTQELLNEQAQYAEARTVAGQVKTAQDARLVGTASEILWKAYLAELRASAPSGLEIVELTVDSLSATGVPPLVTVPLQQERVATIYMTTITDSLPTAATWLDSLRSLRGFADVWSSTAKLDNDLYEVTYELNVNTAAFEKRFFAASKNTSAKKSVEADDPSSALDDESTQESPGSTEQNGSADDPADDTGDATPGIEG